MNDTEERVVLTKEQAKEMLPDGDTIHTFLSSPGVLLGCDYDRKDIEELIDSERCELAGPMARKMNHSLAIFNKYGPLFVATKPKAEDSEADEVTP